MIRILQKDTAFSPAIVRVGQSRAQRESCASGVHSGPAAHLMVSVKVIVNSHRKQAVPGISEAEEIKRRKAEPMLTSVLRWVLTPWNPE